ncbi:DegQ family serine endoprotease [Chitinibacter bivalviorum]|uniref:Probable periplasmic serine endoprotease DegP-like n=1 Tax=Chitinibacter bivalviorum TaxID=2739434 RepID=A0A7H9BKF0_9NEIS|nr:DegQ family serine endoprotease [Chitinibacter bivalviorum]QLG87964.1 DegQ family serine endoprotease [Chitinibacter bivalviorum]
MLNRFLLTQLLLTASVGAIAAPAGLPDFTNIAEKEGRAVVNISTSATVRENEAGSPNFDPDTLDLLRRFGFPMPPNGRGMQPRPHHAQSLGSGFIIDANGYILTNAHVVAKADEITVKTLDKRTFKAKVIGSDARTDVALLKIEGSNLPKVNLGDANKLKQGEWVLAIGQPFGLDNTVTAGIVSAKGRSLPDENFVPFIQTDVAINPGNSGGPLFNMNGEVVGINSQIYSRSGGYMGLSFSIPIDVAMKVADELKATGKITRGRIGVAIQDVNEDLAKSFGLSKATGALLNSVEKDGPADKAGLRAGDILLKFNGQVVSSSSELPRMVSAVKPGTKVPLQIWRDKASRDVQITVGELDSSDKSTEGREYKGKSDDAGKFGLSVQELNPRQLKQLNISFGVLVRDVDGPAEKAGLEAGDVIVGVGSQDLTSTNQLKKALNELKPNESLPLRVLRNGNSAFIVLKAPAK